MALDPGTQLGRYRIQRLLGAGAMGEVYLAEDPQIGRELAIKTVRIVAESGHDPGELKERLVREARAAGRLVHPHIVTLFDAGEWEGVFYLAFEFVDGVDLSDRMRGTPPLTVREALVIARQTAEALDAAHQVGIVHRDIKPANILLDASGKVKISDFGIAKMVGQQTELTQTGSVVGSPHYLSPEQVRGETLDGRSDLFSLGVVLYEMLTRSRPFEGETITTLVYQILSTNPVSLEDSRPQLPPNLARIVTRLLSKDLAHRFASGEEVSRALADCQAELPAELLNAPAAGSVAEIAARRATAASRIGTPTPPPMPPPPPFVPAPTGAPAATPESAQSVELDTAATSLLSSKDTAQIGTAPPPPPAPPAQEQNAVAPVASPTISRRNRSLILILLGALVLLLIVSVAGFLAFRSLSSPSRPDLAEVVENGSESPSPTLHETPTESGQEEERTSREAEEPVWREEEAIDQTSTIGASAVANREETSRAREGVLEQRPEGLESAPSREPVQSATTLSADRADPASLPEATAPQQSSVQQEVAPPQSSSPPPQTRQEPAEAVEVEPVDEAPQIEVLPTERTLQTSLSLAFDVTPEDTFVLLKEVTERRFISIGRAQEWSGKKDARIYELPGPGEYYLRFRRQGRREVTYRLVADHAPGATPIVLRMP